MKRIFLSILAAAGLLTACNMSEVESVNHSGDRIDFFVTTGGMTKAVDVTTANLTGFTVEAFNHNTVVEPYMNAVAFTGGNGTFASATPYYWPQGALDFYAYSQGAATGQVEKVDYRTFTVTPSPTPASQVDFVYAGTTNKTKDGSTSGAIAINFRHTESKVKVQVKNTAPNLKFVISDWKVGYLDDAGTFTYNANETNPYDATTDGTGTLNRAMWSGNTDAAATKSYTNTLASSVSVAANAAVTALTGEMILIPQVTTAASAYASAASQAATNGSYVGLKIKILNRENDAVIYGDGDNTAWAIWPVAFDWEPGKAYTYTVDLCGGGYYEKNHDENADLDPILEGAVISFANVTVDEFASQTPTDLAILPELPIDWDINDDMLVINVPNSCSGNVTLTIGSDSFTLPINGGKVIKDISEMTPGTYSCGFSFPGDENYRPTNKVINFTYKYSTVLEVMTGDPYTCVEPVDFRVNVPVAATGNVSVLVGENTYSAEIVGGSASFSISLGAGHYTCIASYPGDENYLPNTYDFEFDVEKADFTMVLSASSITVGEKEIITVFCDDATGSVSTVLNGQTYSAEIIGGKAIIQIEGLPVGNYVATVTYPGDANYNSGSKSINFEVTEN